MTYLDIPAYHLHHLSGSSQENILRRLTLRHSPAILAVTRSNFSTFSMTTKPRLADLTLLSVGLPCVDITWNNLTIASLYDIGVNGRIFPTQSCLFLSFNVGGNTIFLLEDRLTLY